MDGRESYSNTWSALSGRHFSVRDLQVQGCIPHFSTWGSLCPPSPCSPGLCCPSCSSFLCPRGVSLWLFVCWEVGFQEKPLACPLGEEPGVEGLHGACTPHPTGSAGDAAAPGSALRPPRGPARVGVLVRLGRNRAAWGTAARALGFSLTSEHGAWEKNPCVLHMTTGT